MKLFTSLICSFLLCLPAEADSQKQLKCLGKVIFHEARGEPLKGKLAVAHVVMNRVKSDLFPDTICQVVYQPRQFTDIEKRKYFGKYRSEEWNESFYAAALVYLGKMNDNTGGALFYLNPKKVRGNVLTSWYRKYRVIKQINNHKFFGVK